jgi:hypothetical protein
VLIVILFHSGATMLAAVATSRYACGFEGNSELLDLTTKQLKIITTIEIVNPEAPTTSNTNVIEDDPDGPIVPKKLEALILDESFNIMILMHCLYFEFHIRVFYKFLLMHR